MKRRLKKAKTTSDNKIQLIYEQRSSTGSWDEYSIMCSEKARPSFYTSLQDLAAFVVEMCELPKDYIDRITVRGVSVSYGGEKDVMGATITAQMSLRDSNCPLNLNTPHKASDSYSEGPADERQLLSGDCINALLGFYSECEAYIDGERAQGKLFPAAVAAGSGAASYGDVSVEVTGPMFGIPAQELAEKVATGVGKVYPLKRGRG